MKENKKDSNSQNEKYLTAIEFISKIQLPLNISRTNTITNMLNDNVITYDDIPIEILENYKLNIGKNTSPVENAIMKFKDLKIQYDITKNIENNVNDFMVKYTDCFANINPPIFYIENKINYFFFRMRQLSDIVDFNNIDEYSYPKNSCVLGRANLPQKPVFYASISPITAINEMKKHNKATEFVISKWKIKNPDKSIRIVPTYTKDTEHIFNEIIEIAKPTSTEQQKKYLEFVGEQLLSENYSNSALLAYNIIYKNKMDIITYPSVIDDKGINVAISPQLIDNESIVLDKVYIVEIKPDKKIILRKIGVFIDNKFDWVLIKDLQSNSPYLQEFHNIFNI